VENNHLNESLSVSLQEYNPRSSITKANKTA